MRYQIANENGHRSDAPTSAESRLVGGPGAGWARLLVVDTGDFLCQGLRALLGSHPDVQAIHCVTDPARVASVAAAVQPNVVVMDIAMLRHSRDLLLPHVPRPSGDAAVVVLCDSPTRGHAAEALQAGATAIVSMAGSVEDLIDAVRAVLKGAAWLPSSLLRELFTDDPDPGSQALEQLTKREREVLSLLMNGLDRKAVGARLYCSPETVRSHIRRIMSKLNAHSTIEAIAIGRRLGLQPE